MCSARPWLLGLFAVPELLQLLTTISSLVLSKEMRQGPTGGAAICRVSWTLVRGQECPASSASRSCHWVSFCLLTDLMQMKPRPLLAISAPRCSLWHILCMAVSSTQAEGTGSHPDLHAGQSRGKHFLFLCRLLMNKFSSIWDICYNLLVMLWLAPFVR